MLIRIVGPFAFAYFLSFLFRVVNAAAGPGLVRDIGLDAASLGLLTSTYFLTFAATQIPLGIALDRYGPRLVESVLLLVAALGAAVFALADSLWMLTIGRGLIGFGVSAALMGAFKAFAMAAPGERLPTLNGVQLAAGALGAVAGGVPADFVMQIYGWRGLFLGLAVMSLVAAALVAAFGPPWREERATEGFGDQIRAVWAIMANPVFVRVSLFAVPAIATSLSVQGLWAGPWLRDVQGLDAPVAATVLSLMSMAMLAGYLGFGVLAGRLAERGIPTAYVGFWGLVAFLLVQVALVVLPVRFGPPIWLAYAFFATSSILFYPVLTRLFPLHLAGRVNTAFNFLGFATSFALQWLVGVVIVGLGAHMSLERAFDVIFLALAGVQAAGLVYLLPMLKRAAGR